MNSTVQKLNEHKSSTPSKWREEAEFRIANKSWLRNSQHIAMMIKLLCPRIRRGDTRLTPFAGRQIVSVQLPTG